MRIVPKVLKVDSQMTRRNENVNNGRLSSTAYRERVIFVSFGLPCVYWLGSTIGAWGTRPATSTLF